MQAIEQASQVQKSILVSGRISLEGIGTVVNKPRGVMGGGVSTLVVNAKAMELTVRTAGFLGKGGVSRAMIVVVDEITDTRDGNKSLEGLSIDETSGTTISET